MFTCDCFRISSQSVLLFTYFNLEDHGVSQLVTASTMYNQAPGSWCKRRNAKWSYLHPTHEARHHAAVRSQARIWCRKLARPLQLQSSRHESRDTVCVVAALGRLSLPSDTAEHGPESWRPVTKLRGWPWCVLYTHRIPIMETCFRLLAYGRANKMIVGNCVDDRS